jgi:ribosomal protein S15P/S13E
MSNVKRYIKVGKPSKTEIIVRNAKRKLNKHLRKYPQDQKAKYYLESLI